MALRRKQRYGLTSRERRYYRDGYLAGKQAKKAGGACRCEARASEFVRTPLPADVFDFNAGAEGIKDGCAGRRMWWWAKEGFLE